MDRDRRQGRRIFVAMRDFARNGRGDVKKLQGANNQWRLRVGDWRIVFTEEGETYLAVRVDNRRDAY